MTEAWSLHYESITEALSQRDREADSLSLSLSSPLSRTRVWPSHPMCVFVPSVGRVPAEEGCWSRRISPRKDREACRNLATRLADTRTLLTLPRVIIHDTAERCACERIF